MDISVHQGDKEKNSQNRTYICITTTVHGRKFDIWFYRDSGTELDASLLVERLGKEFHEQVQRIREEAYTQGYNDHKKRKPFTRWFMGIFKTGLPRGGC